MYWNLLQFLISKGVFLLSNNNLERLSDNEKTELALAIEQLVTAARNYEKLKELYFDTYAECGLARGKYLVKRQQKIEKYKQQLQEDKTQMLDTIQKLKDEYEIDVTDIFAEL